VSRCRAIPPYTNTTALIFGAAPDFAAILAGQAAAVTKRGCRLCIAN